MLRQLNILVAPAAYKGSLSAKEVAEAIISGLQIGCSNAQVRHKLLADGGDGTIDALHAALDGKIIGINTVDALSRPTIADYLIIDDFVVIELAKCCGLASIKNDERQPLLASTYGLGQVIQAILATACKKIIIGLGGSASTDGGTGALAALGARFLDDYGNILPLGGGALEKLHSLDLSKLDRRLKEKEFELLVDVQSPLLGKKGAAHTFAQQKGANKGEIEILEKGLKNFAYLSTLITGKDLQNIPGGGAAGGTAFGLATYINASISAGFARIAQLSGIVEEVKQADVIITAEGKLDEQSLQGKATGELAQLCQKLAKPLFALVGIVELKPKINWSNHGFTGVYATGSENRAAKSKNISDAAAELGAWLIAAKGIY